MLALLSKTWRLLLIPLVALAFFLGAYFFFHRGGYAPPPAVPIPLEGIKPPSSTFTSFVDRPPIQGGTLLVDTAHRNRFSEEEISVLLSRVTDRGYAIEFLGDSGRFDSRGDSASLEGKLRRADSLMVILPGRAYSPEEVQTVVRFVRKGGKLLLIGDPGRSHEINSLAGPFGIAFQPDFLYNPVEYDINFQNIFIRNFRPDELTRGLSKIVLYTAGSVKATGPGLAWTDGATRSSLVERIEPFYPLVKTGNGQVVAISDLTFMIPPQNSILSNDRLVSNLADYLTTSVREFELADFPHFFKGKVDVLLGSASLFDLGTELMGMLATFQIGSEIRGVEDLSKDAVHLALYQDAATVAQYLGVAGVQVESTLRTPFAPTLPRGETSVILLHRSPERYVLVILGDTPATLKEMVTSLSSGRFREGLVSDFVGVYKTR